MLELLYKLFIGHAHKWKIIESRKTNTFSFENNRIPKSISTTHTMQCEVCGKIKSYKVEY